MLRITEIFYSLQGEAKTSGLPTVFVRLTGCPLRCQYCDTAYAFSGGIQISMAEVLDQVASFGARYVTVTGGEPLAQPNCLRLMEKLCDAGYQVSLETSGALDIAGVDPRVSIVMEVSRNMYANLALLERKDQVKFVICDRQDFSWASFKVREYDLLARVGEVLFSPSVGQQDAAELAEWILAERLPVRFQMQLHKILWGDKPGV
jgi:7-carboxy-7-deazaguanine synthase